MEFVGWLVGWSVSQSVSQIKCGPKHTLPTLNVLKITCVLYPIYCPSLIGTFHR